MRKNRMMRLASALLILTMVTTCAISGTFAKYVTSDTATDNARVAKWGVGVDVVVEKEGTADGAFGAEYNDAIVVGGTQVVAANGSDKILAPGTNGTLCTTNVEGAPEVAVNVKKDATLTLTGWEVTGDWDNDSATPDTKVYYCPLVINVDGTEYKGTTYASVDLFVQAVEGALDTAAAGVNYEANSATFATENDHVVTWAWAYEGNDDVKDTALGDAAAAGSAATIAFTYTITATQID